MSVPVVVDTREQKPYDFKSIGINNVVHEKLDVGDYTHMGAEDVYAVERKTLDDLAKSLGADRDRFENEIQRGQTLEELAVVIEAPPEDVYRFAGTKKCPNYYSNIYPNSIIGTVEQWPQKYDTLSFVWAGDREGGMQETLAKLDEWYLKHQEKVD